MRVCIATRDLLFRAKLEGAVRAAGGEPTRDDTACELVILNAETPGAVERIRGFVSRGIPVIAYGSHVNVDLLRAAREAGATAVPNSQAERAVASALATAP